MSYPLKNKTLKEHFADYDSDCSKRMKEYNNSGGQVRSPVSSIKDAYKRSDIFQCSTYSLPINGGTKF